MLFDMKLSVQEEVVSKADRWLQERESDFITQT